MTTDTATCSSNNQDKDSGFGQSTDSPENQPLLMKLHRRSPAHCLRERWRAEHPHARREERKLSKGQGHEGIVSIRNSGGGIVGLENRFQQLLELKCQIRNGGECGVYSIRHSIECSVTENGVLDGDDGDNTVEGTGVEEELRMLNEELRSIELECQSIMQAHQLRKTHQQDQSQPSTTPVRSPKDSHKRHGRLADIHEYPERSDSDKVREKDSSSAYNTAESARSTPLGMERSPDHSLQRQITITNQKNLRLASSTSSSPIPVAKSHGTPSRSRPVDPGPVISSSPDQSNASRSESDPALPADDERCEKKGRSRDSRRGIPYCSPYQTTPYQGQGSMQLQVGTARKGAVVCLRPILCQHFFYFLSVFRVTCSCCNNTHPWSIPRASSVCLVSAGIPHNEADALGSRAWSGRSKSALMALAMWHGGQLGTGS